MHGVTVPHWEFDRLVPHLRAAGLRVVRFDLFGHGLSDRSAVDCNFNLFLQQGLAVLDFLRATAPMTILGHSFGATLAAEIANVRPAIVKRLVLVAPRLDFMVGSVWAKVFALRRIGPPFMCWIGRPVLERRRKRRYRVIPLQDIARVRDLLPSHQYLEIADAEHNLQLTHAEQVAAALVPSGSLAP